MKTLSAYFSHASAAKHSASRRTYNALFAVWMLLITGATLSLTCLRLNENELRLGGFLLIAFNALAALLLLTMQFVAKTKKRTKAKI